MTHSNHRRGDRESLEGDYVILARGYRKGYPETAAHARELIKILAKHNPVGLIKTRSFPALRCMRNWKEGMTLDEIVESPELPMYVAGVYTKKEDVESVIRDLAEKDLGFSIVVSGIFEEVFDICKKVGTGPHTVNMSMETIGRTELLPDNKILDITTMCGHGHVSRHLASHFINQVRKSKMTSEKAGLILGKQCVCNFFNPVRAAKLIEEYVNMQR